MTAQALEQPLERQNALRQRVSLLSHLIRWTAVLWLGWGTWRLMSIWMFPEEVTRIYSHASGVDLTGLARSSYVAGFTIVAIDWAITALVVVCVWRLFGLYLKGSIFSADAVDALRNLGWAGVIATAADVVARPMLTLALTMHVSPTAPQARLWADPNDLLHLLMAMFVVVLAHIFKAGVEIADDNRQIV